MPATSVRIVLTTVASAEEAERLGRLLIEERLAACATMIPGARSIYRWKGQVETAEEYLMLLKTVAGKVSALEARLREVHSYETPEIVTIAAESVSRAYLQWLEGCFEGE